MTNIMTVTSVLLIRWLKYTTTNRDGYREYKSDGNICVNCPYLSQCTESKNHVKVITRHIWKNIWRSARISGTQQV